MSAPTVAVLIASLGRPDCVATVVRHLKGQSRPPDRIVLSVVSDADLPDDPELLHDVEVLKGAVGLTVQRNTALDRVGTASDIAVFFDDDFIPSRHAVARIAAFFAQNLDVVGATGEVLADGINTAGIDTGEAERLVAAYDAQPPPDPRILLDMTGLYGCNMAYRTAALGNTRFDERLKMYGWQEDIDFAARLVDRGRVVKTHAFAGVHQGTKRGRASGIKLGYAQIVNPAYLARKGTMRRGYAFKIALRNMAANHWRALRPEPWVDRAGRARGNWIAVWDIVRGRLTPERIVDI